MSKYLLNETKKFRADSEMEANQIVKYFKENFDVSSHSIVRKIKKDDQYFIVQIIMSHNSEKEPMFSYNLELDTNKEVQ